MKSIKEIREKSGLSRSAFSRTYNIPIRSLENWESGVRSCPDYLPDLLDRVVEMDIKNNKAEREGGNGMANKFLHYGKEIIPLEVDGSFRKTLKSKGVDFTELPIIVPKIKNSYVIKYEVEGKKKFAYVVPAIEWEKVYVMEEIPDDCDFYKIVMDESGQSRGEEPLKLKTRAAMMAETAIRNTDKGKDLFENFEEDYKAFYDELIRIGCPIWEIEEMDHHDVAEDWIQKVKESNKRE